MLLSTLQLMILLPLTSVEVHTVYRSFAKSLLAVNGEPTWLPNLFTHIKGDLYLKPKNDQFEKMNFASNYALLNFGRNIEMWVIVGTTGLASFAFFPLLFWITSSNKFIT